MRVLAELIRLGFDKKHSDKVETNNAWGFGGRSGYDHTLTHGHHTVVFKEGTCNFRHLSSEKLSLIHLDGDRKGWIPKFFVDMFEKGGWDAITRYLKGKE